MVWMVSKKELLHIVILIAQLPYLESIQLDKVSRSNAPRVVILIPVYNDWESLQMLLNRLNGISTQCGIEPSIVIVNDGSTQLPSSDLFDGLGTDSLQTIELIHLYLNIGHQSAIAVGLGEIHHRYDCDIVIVMDADGEDKPEDIERFIQAYYENPSSIVVAQRSNRSEGFWFRVFYGLYKIVFRVFVGVDLDFGNFCVIPRVLLGRLAYNPMSWNHLAAGISRSGLNIVRLKTDRGTRFYGKSSMKFERLVSHGLSAVSVFLDIVMIRILIVSSVIMLLSFVGILTVISLRLFTDLAIPGWATSAVGLLSIIGLQGLVLSTMASFVVLRGRSGIAMIPAIDAERYIDKVARVLGDG